MRFRPEQHLRRQSDFRAVREHGRRLNCGPFTFWWLRRPVTDTPASETRRVGVVASAASVGHATRRNRAKRRLREVFRHHQDAVPAGCDILLTARPPVLDLPMSDLARKFVDACHQISARRKS